MSRSTLRRRATALVAAGLLVTTVGCGVDGTEAADQVVSDGIQTPVEPGEGTFEGTGGAVFLNRAATATAEVDTVGMAMTMTMEGIPEMGTISFSSEGAFDNASNTGHMTLDMSEMFGSLGAEGMFPEGAGVMEMVLDGETTYVRSELFSAFAEDGKPWVIMEGEELADTGSGLGGTAGSDPRAFLEFLENSGSEVTEVGVEEVRGGVQATHLRTELDLVQLLDDAPAEDRAEMEEQLEGLGGTDGLATLPVDVWVDEDGYVRQVRMVFDFAGSSDPELDGTVMTMELEMFDFGEPVDIEIPDPSEVSEMDMTEMGGN